MSKKTIKFMILAIIVSLGFILVACAQSDSSSDEIDEDTKGFGSTLELVKSRGELIGGVTTGVSGYSAPNENGQWTGFDVDILRAVAAAVLEDADKVSYRPLSAKERFTALQTGEIDVLSRVSTWTTTRDTTLSLDWAGVNFYDGQGVLVPKASGVNSISELDGASIAVQSGTTTELNLADYFRTNNLKYSLVTFENNEQAAAALEAGRTDAFTSDASQIYALRSKMANPDDFKLLPTIISKEPLGPVVREGDSNWADIVRWSLYAMVAAEEFDITSENIDSVMSSTDNPEIKRLLGLEGNLGKGFGLDEKWAYRVIKQVGNYGEVFRKHLGSDSPLNMERGLNELWTNGGLQYALPFR